MDKVKIKAKQEYVFQRITISAEQFKSFPPNVQERLIKQDQDILNQEKATAADRQKFIQEFKRISAIEFEPYAKSFNLLQELKDDFENELRKTVVDKVKVIKKEIRRLYEKLTPIQRQGFELDDSFHSETLKEVFIHFIETNSLIKPYLNPWYHNSDDDNLIVKPGQAIEYCKQLAEGFNYRLYVEYLNNVLKDQMLAKFIPWNKTIIDIARPLESDICMSLLPGHDFFQTLTQLNEKINHLTAEKKERFIQAVLYKCEDILTATELKSNRHKGIQKKIKVHYLKGKFLKLSHYKKEICNCMNISLNNILSPTDHDYELAYELHVISPITEIIQAIDLKRYLESRLKNIN